MVDITIRNGQVFDGSGTAAFKADVAIKDGRIVSIGSEAPLAELELDARGKAVCPGFIDMHAHSGLRVFADPKLAPKIRQGVTTEVIGVDGISPAPVTDQGLSNRQRYIAAIDGVIPSQAWRWRSFEQYMSALKAAAPSTNLLPLIPHGCVRDVVMGLDARPATAAEIRKMAGLVDQALSAGAGGLSFGLNYYPGAYATQDEIAALVSVAAGYGRVVMVHIRNEADGVLDSTAEMVCLGQKLGAKMHISHLKVVGAANMRLLEPLLELLAGAEARGVAVSFDQYPYHAGSTQLAYLLPPWAHEAGAVATVRRLRSAAHRSQIRQQIATGLPGWENLYQACGPEGIFISWVNGAQNRQYLGQSLQEIAASRGGDALDAAFDLLADEELQVGMIDYYGDEQMLAAIMTSPLHTVGSDGIFGNGYCHPRLYGAFPRLLGRYVRQEKLLALPGAIHNMTARPAAVLGLRDRGLLAAGYRADVVIFDPATVADRATFEEPAVFPTGIDTVIVNGRVTVVPDGAIHGCWGELITF